ncbi:MAG TPA: DUF5668 domain-containing protein [Bryobacteraceae bacterium]|nr:DUF5668 domain-containing protein [Bryobacteraceae bacterium]
MNSLWPLVRAARGPIMLIALGVLFLIDQTDALSFRRSWPILLVLYGVLKLAERLVAPPGVPTWGTVPPPRPQPGWTPYAQTNWGAGAGPGSPPPPPPPPFGGGAQQ